MEIKNHFLPKLLNVSLALTALNLPTQISASEIPNSNCASRNAGYEIYLTPTSEEIGYYQISSQIEFDFNADPEGWQRILGNYSSIYFMRKDLVCASNNLKWTNMLSDEVMIFSSGPVVAQASYSLTTIFEPKPRVSSITYDAWFDRLGKLTTPNDTQFSTDELASIASRVLRVAPTNWQKFSESPKDGIYSETTVGTFKKRYQFFENGKLEIIVMPTSL